MQVGYCEKFLTGVIPGQLFLNFILFKITVVSLSLVTLHNSLHKSLTQYVGLTNGPHKKDRVLKRPLKEINKLKE